MRVLAILPEGPTLPDFRVRHAPEVEFLWSMPFDVLRSLHAQGHELQQAHLGRDVGRLLMAVARFEPDVVFNLHIDFSGDRLREAQTLAPLDLLGVPYTGTHLEGLILSRDKVLTKQLGAAHGILTPPYVSVPLGGALPRDVELAFPLIVKPQRRDASIGITEASVVEDVSALRAQIQVIHGEVGDHALVERYVEGRELYVSLLGNEDPQVLPLQEFDTTVLPEGLRPIASTQVKWDRAFQAAHEIVPTAAGPLPEGVEEQLAREARVVYRMLRLCGYARLDYRLQDDGALFRLEANANPDLSRMEDVAHAAARVGLDYDGLIARILELAFEAGPPVPEASGRGPGA